MSNKTRRAAWNQDGKDSSDGERENAVSSALPLAGDVHARVATEEEDKRKGFDIDGRDREGEGEGEGESVPGGDDGGHCDDGGEAVGLDGKENDDKSGRTLSPELDPKALNGIVNTAPNPKGMGHRRLGSVGSPKGSKGDLEMVVNKELPSLSGKDLKKKKSKGHNSSSSAPPQRELLSIIPPHELSFPLSFNVEADATLLLDNISGGSVAYKIKTTASERYRVTPSTGIIEQGTAIKIQIIMGVTHVNEILNSVKGEVPKDNDKFMILSALIEPSDLSTEGKEQDLNSLWSTQRWKRKTFKKKIEVLHYKAVVVSDDSDSDLDGSKGVSNNDYENTSDPENANAASGVPLHYQVDDADNYDENGALIKPTIASTNSGDSRGGSGVEEKAGAYDDHSHTAAGTLPVPTLEAVPVASTSTVPVNSENNVSAPSSLSRHHKDHELLGSSKMRRKSHLAPLGPVIDNIIAMEAPIIPPSPGTNPPDILRLDPMGKEQGRWQVLMAARLGGNPHGKVYKAVNMESGEIVAAKLVSARSKGSAADLMLDFMTQLAREVEVMRSLKCKFLTNYLGSDLIVESNDKNMLQIYSQLIVGTSLLDKIKTTGKIPEPVVCSYTRQILLGVEYLHRHGIAHKNIRSSNILIEANDVDVLLCDFGLSKSPALDELDLSGSLKDLNQAYPPQLWTAPEMIIEQHTARGWKKADIWSIGCVVLEMLTGLPPWSEISDPLIATEKISQHDVIPVLPPSLSRNAKDFLISCFSRNPSRRPGASSLLLHAFVGSVNTSTTTSAPPQAVGRTDSAPSMVAPNPPLSLSMSSDASSNKSVQDAAVTVTVSGTLPSTAAPKVRPPAPEKVTGKSPPQISIVVPPRSSTSDIVDVHIGDDGDVDGDATIDSPTSPDTAVDSSGKKKSSRKTKTKSPKKRRHKKEGTEDSNTKETGRENTTQDNVRAEGPSTVTPADAAGSSFNIVKENRESTVISTALDPPAITVDGSISKNEGNIEAAVTTTMKIENYSMDNILHLRSRLDVLAEAMEGAIFKVTPPLSKEEYISNDVEALGKSLRFRFAKMMQWMHQFRTDIAGEYKEKRKESSTVQKLKARRVKQERKRHNNGGEDDSSDDEKSSSPSINGSDTRSKLPRRKRQIKNKGALSTSDEGGISPISDIGLVSHTGVIGEDDAAIPIYKKKKNAMNLSIDTSKNDKITAVGALPGAVPVSPITPTAPALPYDAFNTTLNASLGNSFSSSLQSNYNSAEAIRSLPLFKTTATPRSFSIMNETPWGTSISPSPRGSRHHRSGYSSSQTSANYGSSTYVGYTSPSYYESTLYIHIVKNWLSLARENIKIRHDVRGSVALLESIQWKYGEISQLKSEQDAMLIMMTSCTHEIESQISRISSQLVMDKSDESDSVDTSSLLRSSEEKSRRARITDTWKMLGKLKSEFARRWRETYTGLVDESVAAIHVLYSDIDEVITVLGKAYTIVENNFFSPSWLETLDITNVTGFLDRTFDASYNSGYYLNYTGGDYSSTFATDTSSYYYNNNDASMDGTFGAVSLDLNGISNPVEIQNYYSTDDSSVASPGPYDYSVYNVQDEGGVWEWNGIEYTWRADYGGGGGGGEGGDATTLPVLTSSVVMSNPSSDDGGSTSVASTIFDENRISAIGASPPPLTIVDAVSDGEVPTYDMNHTVSDTTSVTDGEVSSDSVLPYDLTISDSAQYYDGSPSYYDAASPVYSPPPYLFQAKAMANYYAADHSELSLHEGDIVSVYTQHESGWWEGAVGDVVGWFPSNFVQIHYPLYSIPEDVEVYF